MMNISVKGTNVIVFYGDAAASRYSDLINRWSGMISPTQWETFQFVLVGTEKPKLALDENAVRLVGDHNTTFFNLKGQAPDRWSYHNLIFDKIRDDNLHLQILIDVDEKPVSMDWLSIFVQAAIQTEAVSTKCMYYLLFGRNSAPEQRETLIQFLQAYPGSVIFLGDTQEKGGRVLPEDRWHAAELALLMNSAEALPVSRGAYSLGYSALNANGTELRLLRERAACRALQEELSHSIQSLAESDLYIQLLPEDEKSISALPTWLHGVIRSHTQPMNRSALKNAWVTIRMDTELSPADAIARMKRFADLNYAANQEVRAAARAYAEEMEDRLSGQLREQVIAACLSPQVLEEIATAFHQMIVTDPQPRNCTYPSKPFLMHLRKGDDAYLEDCKREIMKSILSYIEEVNLSVFAAELERVYLELAQWLHHAQGSEGTRPAGGTAFDILRDIQKELDGSDAGNALRLMKKYQSYQEELEQLHPDIRVLTENIHGIYYQDTGAADVRAWRALVREAGSNLERRLPLGFRGDFFRVLGTEFDTTEEREHFFDEYLSNGSRMYRNLTAMQSNGVSVLLADNRLMDQWFMRREIYEVRTDNAENLTLYPLGEKQPLEYLMDQNIYFMGKGTGGIIGGESLFSGQENSFKEKMSRPDANRGNSLFEREDTESDMEERSAGNGQGVRLVPDEKNEYRLYWHWNGNDPTAMVEIHQFGERIGRAAVIPVLRFHANGENMNVTSDVMEGRPLPPGALTVTIRDSKNQVFVEEAPVQGKREVVRYIISNTRLRMKPENHKVVSKIVLRTIDADGIATYYPLYPAAEGDPWLYEGLSMSHGKIVVSRDVDEEYVYPVRVE